jgi:outer membrane lipoprotein-sorting protein
MRTYRPLLPPLLEIVYDGRQCWLFVPNRKTAYSSTDCDVFRLNDSRIALPARTAIAALVVVPDFSALSSMPMQLVRENEFVILVVIEPSESRREFWINPTTGFVERQVIFDDKGEADLVVNYREQEAIEGAVVPLAVEMLLPKTGASVFLFVDDFRLNTPVPPEAFTFSPPEETTIIQMPENTGNYSFLPEE